MKGHCINLDGQLVCIFPFTNATEFEGLAHNDLKVYGLYDNEPNVPYLITKEATNSDYGYFGFCFASRELSGVERRAYTQIMERDRADIAALALENDAWAAEQVKETDSIASQASTHVKIHVGCGCVTEVEASPVSVTYQIVDLDLMDEDREELAKRVHVSGVIDDGSIPLGDEQGETQEDEGPERKFAVKTIEQWTVLVDYSIMATSKQDAKDKIENGADYLDKEYLHFKVIKWKSVEEA